jgi:hypothetical protein
MSCHYTANIIIYLLKFSNSRNADRNRPPLPRPPLTFQEELKGERVASPYHDGGPEAEPAVVVRDDASNQGLTLLHLTLSALYAGRCVY